MAGKDLNARIKIDNKQALSALDKLAKRMKQVSQNADKMGKGIDVDAKINKAVNSATKLGNGFKNADKQVALFNRDLKQSSTLVSQLSSKVSRLANIYLGVMGARKLIETGDLITSAENRINTLNGFDQKATQDTINKMYTASQNARTGYADMLGNVSKSMTLAPNAFKGNIDNAIRFQEVMAKAYTLGGASQAEQASSMYQLVQALASGTLQGDELRSVREGASYAYQEIERFAQGVYNTDTSLKELASQGKITSDIVVSAIMSAGDAIDEKFAQTAMTWGQAWQQIKNTTVMSVKDITQRMNKWLNTEQGQRAIYELESTIMLFANSVSHLIFNGVIPILTFLTNNLGWLKYVLVTLAEVTICAVLAKAIIYIKGLILGTHPALLLIIGTLVLISTYMSQLEKGAISVCQVIIQLAWTVAFVILGVLTVVAIYSALTGTLILSGWVMVVLAIIAVIAMLIGIFVAGTQEIVGLVYGAYGVIEAVATNIGVAFTNGCMTAYKAFWNFVNKCLELCKPLLSAINAFRSALGLGTIEASIQGKIAWADSQMGDYVSVSGNAKRYYSKGASVGAGIQDKINSLGNKIKDSANPNKLLTDYQYDPASAFGLGDTLGGIGDSSGKTAKNTGKLTELAEEDLTYLRKLAEQEYKKELTSNEIVINMTNNNQINQDTDLDGIVTKLTNKLYEELEYFSDGVYA